MGAYASNMQGDQGLVADFTDPSKPDWLTTHAVTVGLSVLEVERLWDRFQQLGANEQGVVTTQALDESSLTATDRFAKNILYSLKGSDGKINFQTFLNAMKWAQTSQLDTKVRGVFSLLNYGQPFNMEVLEKVMKRVYPDDSQEAIARTAAVFFEQMDKDKKGQITEEDFVQWAQRMPDETLSAILDFKIIPSPLSEEAERLLNLELNN